MTRRLRCTCRRLDHKTDDCLYECGCSGCVCDLGHHQTGVVFRCEHCEHFTVHPDWHQHEPAQVLP